MAPKNQTETDSKIDIVITWVDGNDPQHRSKRLKYLGESISENDPGAQETRFGNANELEYCLLSIFTFAPFIHKVYIITDDQKPDYQSTVNKYFPERIDDIRLVDHKEIFKNYEKNLPVFNSRSIETMLWRIKGLSDKFVYFNDDTFLVKHIKPEDWFVGNSPVIRGKWSPAPIFRTAWESAKKMVFHKIFKQKGFQPRPSFHMGQWNAARLHGFKKKYFILDHTPHTLRKNIFQDFFEKHPEVIENQLSFRFRNHKQFNVISLAYHLELAKGNKNIADPDLSYLQPYRRGKKYIDHKIQKCEANENIKFMCVQSLELCSQENQKKIFGWLTKTMNLKGK
jgi:hypothetical protein